MFGLLAPLWALYEIQIEGKYGWAKKLPCWRKDNKWTKLLLGGRELTGYHFYMILILGLIFHLPLCFVSWSLELEFFLLGVLFATLLEEDFLWFLLNSKYGLRKFNKANVDWHRWWGPLPDSYWYGPIVIAILFYLGLPAL